MQKKLEIRKGPNTALYFPHTFHLSAVSQYYNASLYPPGLILSKVKIAVT